MWIFTMFINLLWKLILSNKTCMRNKWAYFHNLKNVSTWHQSLKYFALKYAYKIHLHRKWKSFSTTKIFSYIIEFQWFYYILGAKWQLYFAYLHVLSLIIYHKFSTIMIRFCSIHYLLCIDSGLLDSTYIWTQLLYVITTQSYQYIWNISTITLR